MAGGPSQWGPPIWNFLHGISYYYPETPSAEQQTGAKNLLDGLSSMIPCDECAIFYKNYLRKNPPPYASGGKALQKYMIDLHNAVNVKVGKSPMPYLVACLIHNPVVPALMPLILGTATGVVLILLINKLRRA